MYIYLRCTVFQSSHHGRHASHIHIHIHIHVDGPRTAKVCQYYSASIGKRSHEDVVGFQVAVDNVSIMEVIQRHEDLSDDHCCFDSADLTAFVFNEGE